MSDNENRYGKVDYFDLREKRLKLVYRILYVVVAIWIASLLCMNDETLSTATIPLYSALLAVSSLIIINIFKYALLEFRCMKVSGKIEEEMLKRTEDKYDNIWNSFGVILSGTALLMFVHIILNTIFESSVQTNIFAVSFGVCSVYYSTVSAIEFFKKRMPEKVFVVLDVINIFVGIVNAYSICAFMGLVTIL